MVGVSYITLGKINKKIILKNKEKKEFNSDENQKLHRNCIQLRQVARCIDLPFNIKITGANRKW